MAGEPKPLLLVAFSSPQPVTTQATALFFRDDASSRGKARYPFVFYDPDPHGRYRSWSQEYSIRADYLPLAVAATALIKAPWNEADPSA